MDFKKLGLRVGLEIHQDLSTKHKLFCNCPPMLFKEKPDYEFLRRLRPSQSELGEIDPAALFEFLKGRKMLYEANRETSCLVEMDEEPPAPLNPQALEICLIFALMTGSKPVDEVHIMRKIVVDGSNTTGFQRTCVVSLGGQVEVGGKIIGLQHIGLEEDAARKIADEGEIIRFRIDRLGIPLMEVATDPDINTPEEAEAVALTIGRILRSTGMVMRGLGSIRQDINISITDGALIEIKGVQELNLVSKVVEYEVQRQIKLLELKMELLRREVKESDFIERSVDVSSIFRKTNCRILRDALNRGEKVFAIKLPGFSGIVGTELCLNRRLGTEMADYARFHAGVKGIFHTDELPAYDITKEEVESLRRIMKANQLDAVVIVADKADNSHQALMAINERAKEALIGVPQETRSANLDGTTHYTRPRPGAARMYPETDVVSIPITKEYLERLKASLPEMPEKKFARFQSDYGLNDKLAKQIIDSEYVDFFERSMEEGLSEPTLLAVTLTETLTSLRRDGAVIENINEKAIRRVFKLLTENKTAKESIPNLLYWLSMNPNKSATDALKELGLEMLSLDDLRDMVEKNVSKNREMIERMGKKALGPITGMMMSELRGRVKPEQLQDLICEFIDKMLKG